MLRFRKRRLGITFEYRWFADRPSPASAMAAVHYMQCAAPGNPLLGFRNRRIYVRIVDLRQDEEAILADMKPRTRTDIRKAERDGIAVKVCDDKREFLEFYNGFAASKRGHVSSLDDQVHWDDNTLVLMAVHGNGTELHRVRRRRFRLSQAAIFSSSRLA